VNSKWEMRFAVWATLLSLSNWNFQRHDTRAILSRASAEFSCLVIPSIGERQPRWIGSLNSYVSLRGRRRRRRGGGGEEGSSGVNGPPQSARIISSLDGVADARGINNATVKERCAHLSYPRRKSCLLERDPLKNRVWTRSASEKREREREREGEREREREREMYVLADARTWRHVRPKLFTSCTVPGSSRNRANDKSSHSSRAAIARTSRDLAALLPGSK